MVKWFLKLVWFGLAAFGLVTISQKVWPGVDPTTMIKGVQGTLVSENTGGLPEPLSIDSLRNLDPQAASEVIGKMVKTELVKILEITSEQVKTFPAKQVKKIKIGACEELLEEDICSVAREIHCE